MRKVLGALLGEQLLSDESLVTLMAEVERILNNRPLTPVSSDPRDLEALSPSQLLLLKPNRCLPLGVFEKENNYSRRRWRQIQYLANIFWRRWVREYLPLLQTRQKWVEKRRNLKVGDLVLVVDTGVQRGDWPLGRIEEVHAGADRLVRSVTVRTAAGVYERPISKICFLEETFQSDEQEVGPTEAPLNIQESEDPSISDGLNVTPAPTSPGQASDSEGPPQEPDKHEPDKQEPDKQGPDKYEQENRDSIGLPLRRSNRVRTETKFHGFINLCSLLVPAIPYPRSWGILLVKKGKL